MGFAGITFFSMLRRMMRLRFRSAVMRIVDVDTTRPNDIIPVVDARPIPIGTGVAVVFP